MLLTRIYDNWAFTDRKLGRINKINMNYSAFAQNNVIFVV